MPQHYFIVLQRHRGNEVLPVTLFCWWCNMLHIYIMCFYVVPQLPWTYQQVSFYWCRQVMLYWSNKEVWLKASSTKNFALQSHVTWMACLMRRIWGLLVPNHWLFRFTFTIKTYIWPFLLSVCYCRYIQHETSVSLVEIVANPAWMISAGVCLCLCVGQDISQSTCAWRLTQSKNVSLVEITVPAILLTFQLKD